MFVFWFLFVWFGSCLSVLVSCLFIWLVFVLVGSVCFVFVFRFHVCFRFMFVYFLFLYVCLYCMKKKMKEHTFQFQLYIFHSKHNKLHPFYSDHLFMFVCFVHVCFVLFMFMFVLFMFIFVLCWCLFLYSFHLCFFCYSCLFIFFLPCSKILYPLGYICIVAAWRKFLSGSNFCVWGSSDSCNN